MKQIIQQELQKEHEHMLRMACRRGNIKSLQSLLENKDIKFNRNKLKNMLYFACKFNHIECVNILINNGFTNWKEGLKGSIESGDINLIKFIEKNSKVCTNPIEHNLLPRACISSSITVFEYLASKMFEETWLYVDLNYAIEKSTYQFIRYIHEKGYITHTGNLLMHACESGNLEFINYILSFDINNVSLQGGLTGACKNGNISLVQMMINKGAHFTEDDFFAACESNNIELVKFIIQKLENKKINFTIALKYAFIGGNIDIINFIIEQPGAIVGYIYQLQYMCIKHNYSTILYVIDQPYFYWDFRDFYKLPGFIQFKAFLKCDETHDKQSFLEKSSRLCFYIQRLKYTILSLKRLNVPDDVIDYVTKYF